jgi:hypothetical protein
MRSGTRILKQPDREDSKKTTPLGAPVVLFSSGMTSRTWSNNLFGFSLAVGSGNIIEVIPLLSVPTLADKSIIRNYSAKKCGIIPSTSR